MAIWFRDPKVIKPRSEMTRQNAAVLVYDDMKCNKSLIYVSLKNWQLSEFAYRSLLSKVAINLHVNIRSGLFGGGLYRGITEGGLTTVEWKLVVPVLMRHPPFEKVTENCRVDVIKLQHLPITFLQKEFQLKYLASFIHMSVILEEFSFKIRYIHTI